MAAIGPNKSIRLPTPVARETRAPADEQVPPLDSDEGGESAEDTIDGAVTAGSGVGAGVGLAVDGATVGVAESVGVGLGGSRVAVAVGIGVGDGVLVGGGVDVDAIGL